MPLVLIQYKTGQKLEDIARTLALQMPSIVAPVLDASEQEGDAGRLTPDDIEVWCTESGALDVNTKDIEIIIWAHEFGSRKTTLEQRKEEIIKRVREVLSLWDRTVSGFVWVLLQPTAFGTL